MDRIKGSLWFKAISLVVITAFITLDIAYAYPPSDRPSAATLALPTPLQAHPVGKIGKRLYQSLFFKGAVLGSIHDIGGCFLPDRKGGAAEPLAKYGLSVVQEDFGWFLSDVDVSLLNIVPVEYIDPAQLAEALAEINFKGATPAERVVFALYKEKKGGERFLVQIARRDEVSSRDLPGYDYVVSEKYVVKYLPEDYRGEAPATDSAKVDIRLKDGGFLIRTPEASAEAPQVSEPIAEIAHPAAPEKTITVRAIIASLAVFFVALLSSGGAWANETVAHGTFLHSVMFGLGGLISAHPFASFAIGFFLVLPFLYGFVEGLAGREDIPERGLFARALDGLFNAGDWLFKPWYIAIAVVPSVYIAVTFFIATAREDLAAAFIGVVPLTLGMGIGLSIVAAVSFCCLLTILGAPLLARFGGMAMAMPILSAMRAAGMVSSRGMRSTEALAPAGQTGEEDADGAIRQMIIDKGGRYVTSSDVAKAAALFAEHGDFDVIVHRDEWREDHPAVTEDTEFYDYGGGSSAGYWATAPIEVRSAWIETGIRYSNEIVAPGKRDGSGPAAARSLIPFLITGIGAMLASGGAWADAFAQDRAVLDFYSFLGDMTVLAVFVAISIGLHIAMRQTGPAVSQPDEVEDSGSVKPTSMKSVIPFLITGLGAMLASSGAWATADAGDTGFVIGEFVSGNPYLFITILGVASLSVVTGFLVKRRARLLKEKSAGSSQKGLTTKEGIFREAVVAARALFRAERRAELLKTLKSEALKQDLMRGLESLRDRALQAADAASRVLDAQEPKSAAILKGLGSTAQYAADLLEDVSLQPVSDSGSGALYRMEKGLYSLLADLDQSAARVSSGLAHFTDLQMPGTGMARHQETIGRVLVSVRFVQSGERILLSQGEIASCIADLDAALDDLYVSGMAEDTHMVELVKALEDLTIALWQLHAATPFFESITAEPDRGPKPSSSAVPLLIAGLGAMLVSGGAWAEGPAAGSLSSFFASIGTQLQDHPLIGGFVIFVAGSFVLSIVRSIYASATGYSRYTPLYLYDKYPKIFSDKDLLSAAELANRLNLRAEWKIQALPYPTSDQTNSILHDLLHAKDVTKAAMRFAMAYPMHFDVSSLIRMLEHIDNLTDAVLAYYRGIIRIEGESAMADDAIADGGEAAALYKELLRVVGRSEQSLVLPTGMRGISWDRLADEAGGPGLGTTRDLGAICRDVETAADTCAASWDTIKDDGAALLDGDPASYERAVALIDWAREISRAAEPVTAGIVFDHIVELDKILDWLYAAPTSEGDALYDFTVALNELEPALWHLHAYAKRSLDGKSGQMRGKARSLLPFLITGLGAMLVSGGAFAATETVTESVAFNLGPVGFVFAGIALVSLASGFIVKFHDVFTGKNDVAMGGVGEIGFVGIASAVFVSPLVGLCSAAFFLPEGMFFIDQFLLVSVETALYIGGASIFFLGFALVGSVVGYSLGWVARMVLDEQKKSHPVLVEGEAEPDEKRPSGPPTARSFMPFLITGLAAMLMSSGAWAEDGLPATCLVCWPLVVMIAAIGGLSVFLVMRDVAKKREVVATRRAEAIRKTKEHSAMERRAREEREVTALPVDESIEKAGALKSLPVRTADTTRLFDLIEKTLVDDRASVAAAVRAGISALEVQEGFTPLADVQDAHRDALTPEARSRIREALMACERDSSIEAYRDLAKKLGEGVCGVEAAEMLTALVIRARQAKRENQFLLLGLESNWIPGYSDPRGFQRKVTNPLVNKIAATVATLRSMGIDNIEIFDAEGADLANQLLRRADATGTRLTNVVIVGSSESVLPDPGKKRPDPFESLRSTPTEARAFVAAIDPAALLRDLAADVSVGSDAVVDVALLDILACVLTAASAVAAGKKPPETPMMKSYDEVLRIMMLAPRARIIDYEGASNLNRGRIAALQSA